MQFHNFLRNSIQLAQHQHGFTFRKEVARPEGISLQEVSHCPGDPGEAENRADGSLWWCSEAVERRGDLEFKTDLNRFKSV